MERNENDLTTNDDTQLLLSYELLALLHWLALNKTDALRQLVARAFESGLHHELRNLTHYTQRVSIDDMHDMVSEFFGVLEMVLLEEINKQAQAKARANNLTTMIERIDTATCGDATLLSSIKQATTKLEHNPHANARELLMKELLRQWKPRGKKISH